MKPPKPNSLIERWKHGPGDLFRNSVTKMPGIEIVDSPFGKLEEGERLDLRGIFFNPEQCLQRVRFRHADMSAADLSRKWIEGCTFHSVCFKKAILQSIADHGNAFSNCTFERTDFRGAAIGYKESSFRDCVFTKANFQRAVFTKPQFQRVHFDHCILRGVDFDASNFEDCKFSGLLRDVWFRGGYGYPSEEKKFGPAPQNRMKNVSFEDAELEWLTFSNHCDLSTVLLPKNGDYRRYDRWKERLEYAVQQLPNFPAVQQREAEIFCQSCLPHAESQEWYIISVSELRSQHGDEVAERLVTALDAG